MAIINWDESFSVNVASIDRQHKRLFELINQFVEKSLSKAIDNSDLLEVLQSLKEYAASHFKEEEEDMRRANYNRMETHVREHQFFIKTVEEFESRLLHDKMLVPLDISNFIREWIFEHIKQTDKKYSETFIEKGIV